MTLKEKKELVSIIIPTFNRRKDAETCLKSIFNQSYAKKEIIIVDDHSTDDTTIYIRKKSIHYFFYRSILFIIRKINKSL